MTSEVVPSSSVPPSADAGGGFRSRFARFAGSRSTTPELDPLIRTLRTYHPRSDLRVLQRAYETAAYLHRDQQRRSGDPYITHPIAVATILAELGMTVPTLAAALLHDTVEDTGYSLDALRDLNQLQAEALGDPETLTRIAQYELAYRMQASVPEVMDISKESAETLEAYGAKPGETSLANNCLLARRLVEEGVRFVHLFDWGWDFHGTGPQEDIRDGLTNKAATFDKPAAALIEDLEQRGLLDETLILCTGEFGRTPFAQGTAGRDHNPYGFSVWMAGGGVRGGTVFGATDELGYRAVEQPVTLYDLWATVLHCVGLDHEALTFRHGGRDMRLTDVHGHVMHDILT